MLNMVHTGAKRYGSVRSMKIGIMSDTHDKLAGIDGAFEIFEAQKVGLVLHCGDWTKLDTVKYLAQRAEKTGLPIKGVLGNNDRDIEPFLEFAASQQYLDLTEGVLHMVVKGCKIAVYHGHHQPTLRRLLLEPVDLLCLGHSHKPRYDRLDPKVIVNPGSTAFAIPRSKSWQASVAIYDTDTREAEFYYFPVKPAA
jgi:putative phosphoesterase